MPTLTTYPKPRKRKAVLVPPKHLKVPVAGTFERAANVKLHRFEREKSQLLQLIDKDLDAQFVANNANESFSMTDIEKAHDVFVATGLLFGILMANKK